MQLSGGIAGVNSWVWESQSRRPGLCMQAATRVRMDREQEGTWNRKHSGVRQSSGVRNIVCGRTCPQHAMTMHSGQARGGLSNRGVFRAGLLLLVVFCSWAPVQAEARPYMFVI